MPDRPPTSPRRSLTSRPSIPWPMTRRPRAWLPPALLAAALMATSSPAPARACVNGVELQVDPKTRDVARAERWLRAGHIRHSMGLAGRTLHELRGRRRTGPLGARLNRVLAVSTVRLAGRVDRGTWRGRPRLPESDRVENLEWARGVLSDLARGDDDPVDHARLAEALGALERWAEAARILEDLDRRDLMPDARSYVTLARARDALGARRERDQALRGCRAVVGRGERGLCRPFGAS